MTQTTRYSSKSKNILYTTLDGSPQSGAVHDLIYLMSGRWQKPARYSTFALLNCSLNRSELTQGMSSQLYFETMPKVRRKFNPISLSHSFFAIAKLARRTASLLREHSIDLIHLNEVTDLHGALAARWIGIPIIWHVRADLTEPRLFARFLTRFIYLCADRIVTVSDSVVFRMFGHIQDRARKIRTIHTQGPDPERFRPERTCSVRKELGVGSDEIVITLVAKLLPRKGHEVLLKAAPSILKRHPNIRILVVGSETDNDAHRAYAGKLRSLVQRQGIGRKILFTGYRSDIPEIMAASDIIVHCSRFHDPFPGVVLQGMTTGRPVVSVAVGGPVEQIRHGIDGLLVPPGDPRALALALSKLVRDPCMRRQMGANGRGRVLEKFSQQRFNDEISALYDEVLFS